MVSGRSPLEVASLEVVAEAVEEELDEVVEDEVVLVEDAAGEGLEVAEVDSAARLTR